MAVSSDGAVLGVVQNWKDSLTFQSLSVLCRTGKVAS